MARVIAFDVNETLLHLRALDPDFAQIFGEAAAQIINAGLRDLFEEVFSADSVRRLKPSPEPYRMAAARLGVPIGHVRLVAAHAWDIAGALRAGCAAAFVARPGMVLDPLVERPDIVGTDLRAIADQIIAVECE